MLTQKWNAMPARLVKMVGPWRRLVLTMTKARGKSAWKPALWAAVEDHDVFKVMKILDAAAWDTQARG